MSIDRIVLECCLMLFAYGVVATVIVTVGIMIKLFIQLITKGRYDDDSDCM